MSDPGVSTQNFLRLLLGGMQKGTDVFQQRQTMLQQQAPDLMLTLQQMMQRKQEREQDVTFRTGQAKLEQQNWQTAFDAQQNAARETRNRQFGVDTQNQFQQMRENIRADAQLKLTQGSAADIAAERKLRVQQMKDEKLAYADLAKQYPKMAPYFGALGGGASPSALGPLLNQIGSLTGNETLDRMVQKGFDDLLSRKDAQGNPIPVQATEVKILMDNVKQAEQYFNKQPDGVAEPVSVTSRMSGILSGGAPKLSRQEAVQAALDDDLFTPSQQKGTGLLFSRYKDLLDQGFIDQKTYKELMDLQTASPMVSDIFMPQGGGR